LAAGDMQHGSGAGRTRLPQKWNIARNMHKAGHDGGGLAKGPPKRCIVDAEEWR